MSGNNDLALEIHLYSESKPFAVVRSDSATVVELSMGLNFTEIVTLLDIHCNCKEIKEFLRIFAEDDTSRRFVRHPEYLVIY